MAVHETDVDDALVEGTELDVDAGRGRGVATDEMAGDGHGHFAEVPDVDAGAGQTAHEGAYQHAGTAVGVPVDGDVTAAREVGAETAAELGGEFGCKIDIDNAADTGPAEERAAAATAPDDALTHDGARFDALIRPQFHVGVHYTVLVQHAVVANDDILIGDGAAFETALAANDRPQ